MEQINLKKPINFEAARELAEDYEKITLADLERKSIEDITGFGDPEVCKICKPIAHEWLSGKKDCNTCFYVQCTGYKCYEGVNEFTYDEIYNYRYMSGGVLADIKARAAHIRNIIKKF